MKGVAFDPVAKTLAFLNGARTVMSAAGVMLGMLPAVEEFTGETLTFPDFNKGNAYVWTGSARVAFEVRGNREYASSYVTALPQEYSNKTVLMDAPAGANFFAGRFRINRTTGPTHTWRGRTVAVLPPEDQWMSLTRGSCLVEADAGMGRALHIYLDDDPESATYRKLVMEAQQSVCAAPGGYTTNQSAGDGVNYASRLMLLNGANNADEAYNGIPIYFLGGATYGVVNSSHTSPFLTGSHITTNLYPGTPSVSRVDVTDYESIYSVDIRGRFGRRS